MTKLNRTVIFLYKGPAFPTGDFLTGRMQIFEKLSARGLDVRVALLSDDPFNAAGIETRRLVSEEVMSDPIGRVDYQSVGSLINRSGRSLAADTARLLAAHEIAVTNDNGLRTLLRDKFLVQETVLDPLGLGIPTALVATAAEADSFMRRYPAEEYVLKPNNGARGMYRGRIKRLAPADSLDYVTAGGDAKAATIIQPAYSFTARFAPAIRPFDAASAEKFETCNRPGLIKEIRMYAFFAQGKVWSFAVGRMLQEKTYWFFIDQFGVPAALYEAADRIAAKLSKLTGASTAFLAIDFGYGGLDGAPDDYHVIEVNGLGPYVIAYDLSVPVADALRENLADMIAHAVSAQSATRPSGILQS